MNCSHGLEELEANEKLIVTAGNALQMGWAKARLERKAPDPV